LTPLETRILILALSTLEATVLFLALEATVLFLALEATVLMEATVLILALDVTVLFRALEATVLILALEATVLFRALEATVLFLALVLFRALLLFLALPLLSMYATFQTNVPQLQWAPQVPGACSSQHSTWSKMNAYRRCLCGRALDSSAVHLKRCGDPQTSLFLVFAL
jgi:hypothetical protein